VTYRARLVVWVVGTLLLAAFGFNVIAGKVTSSTATIAARPVGDVAPVYVPQPLALQYGRSLTDQSSAVDVAVAFLVVYYNADPKGAKTEQDQFAALPHLDPSARGAVQGVLQTDWGMWKAGGSRSTLVNPKGITSQIINDDQAGTTVQLTFEEALTDARGTSKTTTVTATIALVKADDGYDITAFNHQ